MKIGFIGLGAMGRPMAASLQRAGHALQVYDRDCRVAMTLQEERARVSVRVARERLQDAMD